MLLNAIIFTKKLLWQYNYYRDSPAHAYLFVKLLNVFHKTSTIDDSQELKSYIIESIIIVLNGNTNNFKKDPRISITLHTCPYTNKLLVSDLYHVWLEFALEHLPIYFL